MLTRLQIIHNRHRHWLRAFIRFLTYLLAFFLSAIAYWIADNFGEPSLEQVLYHAQFGMEGLVDTDTALIKSFLLWCVLLPSSLSLFLVAVS